jgi:hypothetical protein
LTGVFDTFERFNAVQAGLQVIVLVAVAVQARLRAVDAENVDAENVAG